MSIPEPNTRPFQVHLRGVVELLGRSIYSSPGVYLRELLQNAHDAIAARREEFADFAAGHGGRIEVIPPAPGEKRLRVIDDGIGLDAREVGELLATVGRSSKRDLLDMPRGDRLGQFGIGLLSCFMIADEITVRSRSARGGEPVEWLGRADGTFSVRILEGEEAGAVDVGTCVEFTPRADDAALASADTVLTLARRHAEYLPVAIDVRRDGGSVRINREPLFAHPLKVEPEALLELGEELLGVRPSEAIPLSVPSTGTTGVAYVLPFAPPPGARQGSRAYLSGMLLGESVPELLPEWGFFVRCIVTTTGLHPTASREGLIEDSALEETRVAIGETLRRWVLTMAATRPGALAHFLDVHHLGLRAVAVHDDELAALVLPHLRFETSIGTAPLRELVAVHPRLRYAASVDEFRQLAPLAGTGEPLVNAGHVYEEPLLRRAAELMPGVVVERAEAAELLDALAEPPLEARDLADGLESRAGRALEGLDCVVAVRSFSPGDVPAVYVTDRRALRAARRRDVAAEAGGLWGAMLGKLDAGAAREPAGRLCLNWANPLVRTLAEEAVPGGSFDSVVRVLYAQALLAGHHPLRRQDRAVLTDSLGAIVRLGVGLAPEA